MDEFDALLKKFDEPKSEESSTEDDKPSILVIDDDESMRRGISRALEHKYQVETAESGQKGIEIINKAFHCVILDVKMRDMNGFSTYPQLKGKCPEVPIIFFTAFQSEHDLQEVINKYKPEGYIEKGKDISFLEHLIENAIKKYKLVLENEEYKRDLEKKVEERTAELQEANSLLTVKNTEIEKAYKQIASIRQDQIQSAKMAALGFFYAGMMHEVKNGLTGMDVHARLSDIFDQHPKVLEQILLLEAEQKQTILQNGATVFQEAKDEIPLDTRDIRRNKKELAKEISILTGDQAETFATCGVETTVLRNLIELVGEEKLGLISDFFQHKYSMGTSLYKLKEGLERIQKIIDSMQYFANPKGDEKSQIDLHKSLDVSLTFLKSKYKQIEIEKKYDPNLKLPVGSANNLNQVFTNILLNAAQAIEQSGRPGVITVETGNSIDQNMEYSFVKIADSGDGIPEDQIDKIFDPFYSTKDVGDGFGLRLSICQSIMEKQGGKITVQSPEGSGAVFTVLIPVSE